MGNRLLATRELLSLRVDQERLARTSSHGTAVDESIWLEACECSADCDQKSRSNIRSPASALSTAFNLTRTSLETDATRASTIYFSMEMDGMESYISETQTAEVEL